jgi:hypothetical protein
MSKRTSVYSIHFYTWSNKHYLVRFYRRDPRTENGEQAHGYRDVSAGSLGRVQQLISDGEAIYLLEGRAYLRKQFGPPPPTRAAPQEEPTT